LKRAFIIALACLMLWPAAGFAQKRRGSGRRSNQRNTNTTAQPAADPVRTGAERVAEQIKSLGQFLYLYGPIARELQGNEAAAQNNQLQPAAAEAVQRNKGKLRDAFRSYRQRMDDLESAFSSSSELRGYYNRLLGVAARAASAEEQVTAGQYDQAGKSLLEVLNRLTDLLAGMR
jgi:hypothetical protein